MEVEEEEVVLHGVMEVLREHGSGGGVVMGRRVTLPGARPCSTARPAGVLAVVKMVKTVKHSEWGAP